MGEEPGLHRSVTGILPRWGIFENVRHNQAEGETRHAKLILKYCISQIYRRDNISVEKHEMFLRTAP
jgi:hypothetical protein